MRYRRLGAFDIQPHARQEGVGHASSLSWPFVWQFLAIGGVAYATGGNDQGSGNRAWAQVNPNGGSPVLVRTDGFVSVTSPGTGIPASSAPAR
jgi:hypothetical protein